MRTEDQVITQFNMRLIRAVMPQGAPMIVVYEDPKDYPGLFVARLFDGRKSTHLIALADTLEDIREAKPERMRIVNRIEKDSLQMGDAWLYQKGAASMRKKAAGILKAVWTIVISVALISAGLMCLSLQKQVEELSRLPKNVLVYDRSRKEIVEYYGTPERIGSSLVLHDANILNIEDVSHLVE